MVTDPDGNSTDLDLNATASKIKGPPCRRCALGKKCRGADKHYVALFGWEGFEPVRKAGVKEDAPSGGRLFLSDNDRCLVEILRLKKEVSTKEALRLSKKIVLCRDCSDGNAVMNSASRLAQKGLVKSRFKNGTYFWSLAKPYARIKKWL